MIDRADHAIDPRAAHVGLWVKVAEHQHRSLHFGHLAAPLRVFPLKADRHAQTVVVKVRFLDASDDHIGTDERAEVVRLLFLCRVVMRGSLDDCALFAPDPLLDLSNRGQRSDVRSNAKHRQRLAMPSQRSQRKRVHHDAVGLGSRVDHHLQACVLQILQRKRIRRQIIVPLIGSRERRASGQDRVVAEHRHRQILLLDLHRRDRLHSLAHFVL